MSYWSVLCQRLRRLRIELIVSIALFLLAYLDAFAPWSAVDRLEKLGVAQPVQVLITVIGALLVLLSPRCGWLFYLGTMPLVARIVVIATVAIETQGSYQTVVLYSLCLIFIWLLYAQDACADA